YGHGKYETLATAIIGGALLLVGAGIFWGGAVKIWASVKGEHMEAPGAIALAAAIVSIIVKELVEESLGEDTEAEILAISAGIGGVADPHNLRTRRIGSDIAVDLHVRVDGDMPVVEAHALASKIEERIRERFGPSAFVSVHVEPLLKEGRLARGNDLGNTVAGLQAMR
ncbi:MAG: cation transporter dimerization domain-containing protein, partial [Lentisphaerota bacterium]